MQDKHCSKCKTVKPCDQFAKRKSAKDGLDYWCRSCSTANHKKWREKDPEKHTKYKAEHYEKNKERYREQNNRWRVQNLEKDLAYKRDHYSRNKPRYREWSVQWQRRNRKKQNAYLKARRERVRVQTPDWADLDAITEFYANCPAGYHVDHIFPLAGKTSCGLHVLENLQYLPASENLSKSNREPKCKS